MEDSLANDIIKSLECDDFLHAEQQLLDVVARNYLHTDVPTLFRACQEQSIVNATKSIGSQVSLAHYKLLQDMIDTLLAPWHGETDYIKNVDRIESGTQKRLFEDKSSNVLDIMLAIPVKVCNYRCSYCYITHDNKPDRESLHLLPKIIERLGKIPRPLTISLYPLGDIIAIPTLWPLLQNISALDNVVSIELWSNLSRDMDDILKYVQGNKKIFVAGSYHPSGFKAFEVGKENFFRRVADLRDNVADVTINMVAATCNMPFYHELKSRLDQLGVYLSISPLRGARNGDGKMYPLSYSNDERNEIRKMINNDFISYFMLDNKRAAIRCSVGRDYLEIDNLGNVLRCSRISSSYGNILDECGPLIDSIGRYCPLGGCSGKVDIGYIAPCLAEYKRIGTKHHYIKRDLDVIGTHSYDAV